MEIAKRQCAYCGKWYRPDPRTAKFQKACDRSDCRLARKRQGYRRWIKLNPGYEHGRRAKLNAWGAAYPDYWQHYRETHPEYIEREKRRLREKRRKLKTVAKQNAISKIAVEKLRDLQSPGRKNVAKQITIARRTDQIIEYLIWQATVAKQITIVLAAGAVP